MTIIYRGVVTPKFRTTAMMNFIGRIADTADSNTYYMSFGRATPWSTYESSSYFKPPYPVTNDNGIAALWDDMLGLVKVSKTSWIPVIPRRDWGNPNYQDSLTFHIDDVVVVNSLTGVNKYDTSDAGYMVYRCVQEPQEDGVCSVNQLRDRTACLMAGGAWTPTASLGEPDNIPKGKNSAIDTGDGYLWAYLYTIPPDEVINSTNDDYIVVPTPDEIQSNPTKWGIVDLGNINQISRTIFDINCSSLMGSAQLTDRDFTNTNRVGNTGYRQLAILVNPLLTKSHQGDPDVKATAYSYTPDQLLVESGEVLYVENRPPIYRSSDQTESIRIILSF